jgi:hypothetical protein
MFLEDWWIGHSSSLTQFQDLFYICNEPYVCVSIASVYGLMQLCCLSGGFLTIYVFRENNGVQLPCMTNAMGL